MSRNRVDIPWLELLEPLAACHRELHAGLAAVLARQKLSLAEFLVLWSCPSATEAGVAQSDLAQRHAVSAAHMSGLVEQLRVRGWLKANRDQADRRRQLWRTTPEGAAIIADALVHISALEPHPDPELLQTTLLVLRRLEANLTSISMGSSTPSTSRGAA